jgi:tetratricopeptide (TPR) repeat protein
MNEITEQDLLTVPQRVILAVSLSVLAIVIAGWIWLRMQPETPEQRWQTMNREVIEQVSRQNYGAAIHSGRMGLDLARGIFAENDIRRAVAAENLAEALRRSGDFDAALPVLLEGLAVRRMIPDANDDALVTPLNNVACLYEDLFLYSEAETFFIEALSEAERCHGPQGRITAIIMRNMARLYQKMIGKHEEAAEYSARADAVLGPLDEKNITPRF